MKNIAANSMPMIQVLRLISLILPVKSLMKMLLIVLVALSSDTSVPIQL